MNVAILEILKNYFFLLFYVLTWVISIIKLPKYFDSYLKYLPIIIGYTLFTEILGALIFLFDDFSFFSKEKYTHYNIIIYTLYDLIFFTYFFYIYWKTIKDKKTKSIIKLGGILFILSLFGNALYKNPLLTEMVYNYVIGAIVLLIAVIVYLKSLNLKSQPISMNLLFWISIGLLVFHLGYLPIIVTRNLGLKLETETYAFMRNSNVFLIVIMYSCFIIGFLKMGRFKAT